MERGASACGKVILFGEHAVVYGQPALAAGIARGVVVRGGSPAARLGLRLHTPGGEVVEATRGGAGRLSEALTRLAESLEAEVGSLPSLTLEVESALPPGAGLGSSAALAVAVARALLGGAPGEEGMARVLRAATAAESVFHGNPSGVDHTTAAYGGVLRFVKGAAPEVLTGLPPLRLVVAQVEPGADTGVMVAGVRALRERSPARVDALLREAGALTDAGLDALRQGDLERLGLLMNLAHGLLHALGVSTEALDRGCHRARAAGALGAKLTGAGGGGCLVALVREPDEAAVTQALRDAGALQILSDHSTGSSGRDDHSHQEPS